jgi:adenylyltransferase/sulfurtransferase
VLLVGAGGLGSPLGLYLAAAGVGHLGVVDFDVVEHSNLQRQILHGTKDVGRRKVESARERLNDINPNVEIVTYDEALTSDNAFDVVRGYDIVIDGTDNFPTRYLVNDVCVLLGKPNVYGSIYRFEGQASVFWAARGPCYRCLYAEPPPPALVPSCAEGGVLGVLPGIIGTIQAIEAIKLIIEKGSSLVGRLLLFDALTMQFREFKIQKDPQCPICGENPTIRELIDYDRFCGLTPPDRHEDAEITPRELKERLDRGDRLVLLDVRNAEELEISRLSRIMWIPLPDLPSRVGELQNQDEIVVICHVGQRSVHAVRFLRNAGFHKAKNLVGGMDRWALEVDPTLPRY